VVEVSASGDDANRVIDAGRRIDDEVTGSEAQLVEQNPLLQSMARIAREFGVSVTLSVYPTSDDNEVVDEDGRSVDDD
jgi:hypothetical protein